MNTQNFRSIMEIDYPTVFLVSLFFGLLGAYLAPKRKRNPFVWFTVGALFSLGGLIFLFLLPPGKNTPAKKERIKPPPPLAPPPNSETLMKMWYYLDQKHKSYGPVDFTYLKKNWSENKLSEKSYLWSEGMEKWEKIEQLPDVKKALVKSS